MHVDLNADVGEGFGRWELGDDEAMLAVVTSANVACGFHAGDPSTMRRLCATAAARGVRIGAQVSYPDLVGFGRRRMDVDRGDLVNDVLYQLGALDACARAEGARVSYVKPHGALNNTCDTDVGQAAAIAEAIGLYDGTLPLLARPGTQLAAQALAQGVTVVTEAYPDRAYTADGRLAPRGEPGAVLHDPGEIASRALELATTAAAQSLCLHGDNPASVLAAAQVRDALLGAGVELRPFADA